PRVLFTARTPRAARACRTMSRASRSRGRIRRQGMHVVDVELDARRTAPAVATREVIAHEDLETRSLRETHVRASRSASVIASLCWRCQSSASTSPAWVRSAMRSAEIERSLPKTLGCDFALLFADLDADRAATQRLRGNQVSARASEARQHNTIGRAGVFDQRRDDRERLLCFVLRPAVLRAGIDDAALETGAAVFARVHMAADRGPLRRLVLPSNRSLGR